MGGEISGDNRQSFNINVAIAGATGEIATNAIKLQARVDMQNIPYKGGGPAVIAVVSAEFEKNKRRKHGPT